MFKKHTAKALHVLFGAAVTGAILTATPAHAADSVERAQSTMNQASVYESTLKFYLHPARLELGSEPPRERMDHPAVIVARRAPAGYDWTTAFILHPARLTLASEAPRPMGDHPAVAVAKAGRVESDSTAKITRHPATVAKAAQVPPVYTTHVIDLSGGE
jgi:predicted PP-loop superfamily ATPase